MNSALLGLLFAAVALIYASVGFGGGSSYAALLVLAGVSYRLIPSISLVCNIVVVAGNCMNYFKSGDLNWRLYLLPTIFSVPMAYLGGRINVSETVFLFLLCTTLTITGIRLLLKFREYSEDGTYKPLSPFLAGTSGAVLGFVAGITGIGGGIFLSPIMHYFRAGSPKQIAATASFFILVNSISGLIGQLQKNALNHDLFAFWYLPLVVIIGGQIGNRVAIKIIPQKYIALITAALVLFVAAQLAMKLLQ
jgi:hypothetical protein